MPRPIRGKRPPASIVIGERHHDGVKRITQVNRFAIIIQVIISWVSPGTYNPVTVVLYKLTEPLLRPARRYIPPMGGLDFSAIAVFIILRLITILFINPLAGFGLSLA